MDLFISILILINLTNPLSLNTITPLIKKFKETKILHNLSSTGRPSLKVHSAPIVQESLQRLQSENIYGHASTLAVSHNTGISRSSVHRIVRNLGMYPYHMTLTQSIKTEDHTKRAQFAYWIQQHVQQLDTILWSDEAHFTMDGSVNRYNCVIWSYENPHRHLTKSLHPARVTVWIGFSARYKLTPIIFEENVTAERYHQILNEKVFPELRRRCKLQTLVFQHDGAPPHFSKLVQKFLESQLLPNRVISRGYGIFWPQGHRTLLLLIISKC